MELPVSFAGLSYLAFYLAGKMQMFADELGVRDICPHQQMQCIIATNLPILSIIIAYLQRISFFISYHW